MNTIVNIVTMLFKIVWEIVKVFLKVVKVMCVLFFAIFLGTPQSNRWQYNAEYYHYE